MTKLIALVYTGDKNKWVWPYWYAYFNENWNWNSGIDVYFVNEVEKANFGRVKNIKVGKNCWSQGLSNFLDSVSCSHVLFLLEDCFLIRPARTDLMQWIVNTMVKHKIGSVKLFKNRWSADAIKKAEQFHGLLKFESPLLASLLPTIWNRDVLANNINIGESAWSFERIGTRRLRAMGLRHCLYVEKEVFPYRECIRQGVPKMTAKKFYDRIDNNIKPYRWELPK